MPSTSSRRPLSRVRLPMPNPTLRDPSGLPPVRHQDPRPLAVGGVVAAHSSLEPCSDWQR